MTHSLAIGTDETAIWAMCSCDWEGSHHVHHYPRLSPELLADAYDDAQTAAVEEGQEHLCDVA